MTASYPASIKNFGNARIDGEYMHAEDINTLRDEVVALETTLATITAALLSPGANGNLLSSTGSAWSSTAPLQKASTAEVLAGTQDAKYISPKGLADSYAFKSGLYTPSLTNSTNVAASTAWSNFYYRIGEVVSVAGTVSIDTTTTGATTLQISLPIASTFANSTYLAGSASMGTEHAVIFGGTGVATLSYTAVSTANNNWRFHFTYRVV